MEENYTFFKTDINHIGRVLQSYLKTGANPKFDTLLNWIIDHGHPTFSDVPPFTKCSKPLIIQERQNKHNTNDSVDATTVENFEGGRFFFPDAFEPTTDAGIFHDPQSFARAMFKGTTPTLLFHGGNYASAQDAQIEDVFPVVFLFGKGGVQGPRENG
eukprot:6419300-Ditylum_brightwellii.AAC.2